MKELKMLMVTLAICCLSISSWAGEINSEINSKKVYFDRVTEHRYVQVDDATYNEFNKRGEFLRIVSSDQPHLNNRDYVIEETAQLAYVDRITGHRYVKIDENTYNEYTRNGEFFKTVPADQPHLNNRDYVLLFTQDNLEEKTQMVSTEKKEFQGNAM